MVTKISWRTRLVRECRGSSCTSTCNKRKRSHLKMRQHTGPVIGNVNDLSRQPGGWPGGPALSSIGRWHNCARANFFSRTRLQAVPCPLTCCLCWLNLMAPSALVSSLVKWYNSTTIDTYHSCTIIQLTVMGCIK